MNSQIKCENSHIYWTRSFASLLLQDQIIEYKYNFFKFIEKLNKPIYDQNTLDEFQFHAFLKHLGMLPHEPSVTSILQLRSIPVQNKFDLPLILQIIGRMTIQKELQNQIRKLFSFFDKPKHNRLSALKLNKGLTRIKEKLASTSIDDMMMKYDLDGDGYLNFDEFLLMMLVP